MGYFPGYDMERCWYCGRTDCNGNHQGAEADAAGARITHFEMGFGHPSCPCHCCQQTRALAANREARKQQRN
jgi:hypothetical protein